MVLSDIELSLNVDEFDLLTTFSGEMKQSADSEKGIKEFTFNDIDNGSINVSDISVIVFSDGRCMLSFHFKSKGKQNDSPVHRVTAPWVIKVALKTLGGATLHLWDVGFLRWDCNTNEAKSYKGNFDASLFEYVSRATIPAASYSVRRC